MAINNKSKTSKWLVVSSYLGVAGTLGGFIATAVYAKFLMPQEQGQLTAFGIRLLCVAIISLGWTFIMGLIYAIFRGAFYSGFRRGSVSRTKDPVHFWLLLGTAFLFPLAMIGYGLFKFINP